MDINLHGKRCACVKDHVRWACPGVCGRQAPVPSKGGKRELQHRHRGDGDVEAEQGESTFLSAQKTDRGLLGSRTSF